MVHPGLAMEIAKAWSADRRSEAARARRPRTTSAERVDAGRGRRSVTPPALPLGAGGPPVQLTPFEQALAAGGSILLLALVVLGPLGLVVPILAAVVVAGLGLLPVRGRRATTGRPAGGVPADPADRWMRWRAVEPDPGYVGRRAA
jgi:hypothetical protein